MTSDQLIDGLLTREGGFRNVAGDRGGATNYGITAATWGRYKRLGREATIAEVKAITREQAVAFYRGELARSPFAGITYEPLFVQLFDFGENSGTARAMRWLQRVLRVPVTGVLDDRTQVALRAVPNYLVHEALIGARCRMLVKTVDADGIARSDEHGLLERAVSFSELQV